MAGNVAADHSTIAAFRCRHERALGEVFFGVLGLCARAGLVSVGVVAIDGTKMSANASINADRDFGQVAREILEAAAEIDRREDELYGAERGDELPEHLRTRGGRRKAWREAKQRLDRERRQATEPAEGDGDGDEGVAVELSGAGRDAPAGSPRVAARGPPHAGRRARRAGAPDPARADGSAV